MTFHVKHKPGTSVIISTYNRVESAVHLVRSVVNQVGYTGGLEILVVNDNGDPRVLELARKVERPPGVNIRGFDTGFKGYGLVLARNTGLRFASYDTAVFLDDDMEIEPILVSCYQQAPPGVRLGRIDFRVEIGGETRIFPDRRDIMTGPDRQITPFESYVGYLYGGNFCIRTAFALVLGGFDEAYLDEGDEDTDFGCRAILAAQSVVAVPSARAVHNGPDLHLARELGLQVNDRVSRSRERLSQRTDFVANGGLEYWAGRQWSRRLR
jgi:glycosyltransferase involved in cell wall biosynthesis